MSRLIALLMLAVAACGTAAPTPAASPTSEVVEPPDLDVSMASLKRTNCMGYCPVYEVRIARDGFVS